MNGTKPVLPPGEETATVTKHWCSSYWKTVKSVYTWTIHDFSYHQTDIKNHMLRSSSFSAGTEDEIKWQLTLYPNGKGEANEGYVSLFLRLQESEKSELSALFIFSILDAKGNKTNAAKSRHTTFRKGKDDWGSTKFVSTVSLKNDKDNLLIDDKLTIVCEITAFKDTVNVCGPSIKIQSIDMPPCSLINDIGASLEDKNLSDVMFTVSDENFCAHKAILAARSPFFSEIFTQEKKRDEQELMNLSDIKKDVFREVLRYIYTGKSPKLAEMVDDLLEAANRFGLSGLKVMCEQQLCKNITVENVSDVLILSDTHGAQLLKIQAQEFIISHMKDVKNTEGFKRISLSHPNLLIDTLSVLSMRIVQ